MFLTGERDTRLLYVPEFKGRGYKVAHALGELAGFPGGSRIVKKRNKDDEFPVSFLVFQGGGDPKPDITVTEDLDSYSSFILGTKWVPSGLFKVKFGSRVNADELKDVEKQIDLLKGRSRVGKIRERFYFALARIPRLS